MIDLEEYRENARMENLCSEYSKIWDSCTTKKQLMDMALGAKGIDYLCDSIAKGWGISPSILADKFAPFLNGNYTAELNGYNSKMYCQYNGDVVADTTALTLIDCCVDISVPDTNVCEIYCTGECNINVSGKGQAIFICYGDPKNITIEGLKSNKYFKRINKKNRDTYD